MLKRIGLYLLMFSLVGVFAISAIDAAREATIGGMDSSGNHRWTVESGNLVPGADASYTIGSASNKPSVVYTDALGSAANPVPSAFITSQGSMAVPQTNVYANMVTMGFEEVTVNDTGVASANTVVYSFITSDTANGSYDILNVADGTDTGQIKICILETDTEDSGVQVTPANYSGGTDILLEDAGDVVGLVWKSPNWHLMFNNGGTIQ